MKSAPLAWVVAAFVAAPAQDPSETKIPASITSEHQELHDALIAATRLDGKTGAAARELAARLHPHFEREEEVALPPLGALRALAEGRTPKDAASLLKMSETLKAELPRMLEEHRGIGEALRALAAAARAEGRADVERFAEKLALHAKTEEEVLYPAAVLVGEVLRLRAR